MTPGKYQCDIQQMTQVLILLKKRWTERDGESSFGTPTRGHEDADKVNSFVWATSEWHSQRTRNVELGVLFVLSLKLDKYSSRR